MKMKLLALVTPALFLMPAIVSADTFNFSYTDIATGGTVVNVVGQLTGDPTGLPAGEYLITGVSGFRNGSAITGLLGSPSLPLGSSFSFADTLVDDLLNVPATPGFFTSSSSDGFDFATADGGQFDPYFDPGSGQYYEYAIGSGAAPGTQINFAASAVPEPSTLILLAIGIPLVLVRRRHSNRPVAL
jgi:hypothetical protein